MSMELTADQKDKVSADQWYGDPYEHIKTSEPLTETVGDAAAVQGGTYTALASPFGTVVSSARKFTFLGAGLGIDSGDLKVVFHHAGLRAADASIRGIKGKPGTLTVSAFNNAGKQLRTVTESLGEAVTSILFEDLPSDVHELRFSGGSFVFLGARAINRITTTPVQNDW